MKKILLTALAVILSASFAFADKVSLTDNVALSDNFMRKCMRSDRTKNLIVSGAIGDTFAVTPDGVVVFTITLVATDEIWSTTLPSNTFLVNMSANGTEAADLYCWDDK